MNGIFYDMSNEAYHETEALSRSDLWLIHNRTPLHFKNKRHRQTDAMRIGTAVHAGVLEPEKFFPRYGRLPDNHVGTTIAGKAAIAEIKELGKEPLKADVYDMICSMRDRLWEDEYVKDLLNGAKTEVSAFCEYEGFNLKCRPDAVNGSVLIDLKTTESAAPEPFARSIASYGYHVQDAYYSDVYGRASGKDVDAFIFLAVEKTPPYAFTLYQLDVGSAECGRFIYKKALEKLKECQASGNYPSYPKGINEISLPSWCRDLYEGPDEVTKQLMEE